MFVAQFLKDRKRLLPKRQTSVSITPSLADFSRVPHVECGAPERSPVSRKIGSPSAIERRPVPSRPPSVRKLPAIPARRPHTACFRRPCQRAAAGEATLTALGVRQEHRHHAAKVEHPCQIVRIAVRIGRLLGALPAMQAFAVVLPMYQKPPRTRASARPEWVLPALHAHSNAARRLSASVQPRHPLTLSGVAQAGPRSRPSPGSGSRWTLRCRSLLARFAQLGARRTGVPFPAGDSGSRPPLRATTQRLVDQVAQQVEHVRGVDAGATRRRLPPPPASSRRRRRPAGATAPARARRAGRSSSRSPPAASAGAAGPSGSPPVSSRKRSSSRAGDCSTDSARTRAAASSSASGMPSSRRQISATAAAFCSVSANAGWPPAARSTNRRTASDWRQCLERNGAGPDRAPPALARG